MNNTKSIHHSPCRYYEEHNLQSYCMAVKPCRSCPDCNFGTESYCITGKYRPQNLYKDTKHGCFVYAVELKDENYTLVQENA